MSTENLSKHGNPPRCPDCGATLEVFDPVCWQCPDNCGWYHEDELMKLKPWSDPHPTAPAAGDATPRSLREVALEIFEESPERQPGEGWASWEERTVKAVEKILEREAARLSALADGYKKTLLFVRDECDWEHQPHSKDGGDDRIGPAITAAVGEGKLPVVRHEELASLKADLAALRAEWSDMPSDFGYYWVKRVGADVALMKLVPGKHSEIQGDVEVWDCPGIGRYRLNQSNMPKGWLWSPLPTPPANPSENDR